jgi:aerobic carbon-monoxide dehydrogenase large subunit
MSASFKGRREDRRLLTGGGRFTADWDLPGQAHAAFLRSDRAHARIVAIDATAALAVPGVLRVLTGADVAAAGYKHPQAMGLPPGVGGMTLLVPGRPALAQGVVRFAGEPVALVVAETADQAQEAVEAIVVEYDDLSVLTIAGDAALPGAVQLHETVPGNLVFAFEYGDRAKAEAAFTGAARVIKLQLDAQRIAGVPMEPKACLAAFDKASGRFDVYMQTQGMGDILAGFAHVTGVAREKFRIHAHDVGGAYGVRNELYPENIAVVLAAQLTGRPVKWVGTREETLVSDHHGRAALLTGELALDKDARFIGLKVDWLINMGAYCSNAGPLINTVAAPRTMATNVYQVPAIYGHHRLVLTNTTPTTAYRGAGRPNVAYLWERLVDEAARATGIDRVEIRRRNVIGKDQFPYQTPTGSTYDSGDPAGLLDAALAASNWNGFAGRRKEAEARGRLRGIGLALFIEPSGSVGSEEIAITFRSDGTLALYTLAGPSGQGYETVYPEIVAGVLGIDAEKLKLRNSDPEGPVLTGTGSFGSRSLISHGAALHAGALEVVAKGREIAAGLLEVSGADLDFSEGRYTVKGTDLSVSLEDIAGRHTGSGPNPLDTMTKLAVSGAYPSGAHIAEVEIDPGTGKIEIVDYTAADDCGIVYNHKIVEGQMRGGLMQGIGQVMGEHCIYDPESGQLLTGSFMDYVMPRADALPKLTLIDRPVPSPANPLGAKGAGEAGATGSVPALANAVYDALAALGIGQLDMPYSPGRIWQAMQEGAKP